MLRGIALGFDADLFRTSGFCCCSGLSTVLFGSGAGGRGVEFFF